MIPILLISDNEKKTREYINTFIAKHVLSAFSVFELTPEKNEMSINEIRELRKEFIFQTAQLRLFILHKFDTATVEAQNALLKTLEEKSTLNQFILVSEQQEYILPTIRSRCICVKLTEANEIDIHNSPVNAIFNDMQNGSGYSFFGTVAGIDKDEAKNLFDESIVYWRGKLADTPAFSATIMKKAMEQKALLLNNNLNPQLAVDSFFLFCSKVLTG